MKVLFILLLTFQISFIFAQTGVIRGKITASSSGESLIGASVKAAQGGALSDLDGNYSLTLPAGKHLLEFVYTGFESKSEVVNIEAGQTVVFDVKLVDNATLLSTTTVTAGKYEKPLGEVTVSLDVIKPKFVKSQNSTSIDEALDRVPGVNIIDGQANIRGGSGFSYGAGTRVLLLVDDMPILQADAGFPNWDDLPVENIAQLEVLKGAASALYGSSAMNGIINIRTGFAKAKPETEASVFTTFYGSPKDERKKWWGRDTADYKQPFQTGFSFVHRRKAGKWDLVLGGNSVYRDSYNEKTYVRYARVSPSVRYQYNEKLSFGINTNFNVGRSGSFFIWGNDSTLAYQPGLNSTSFSKGRTRFNIDPSIQYFDRSGGRHKLFGRLYSVNNHNSGNQSNKSISTYAEYQYQKNIQAWDMVLTTGLVNQNTRVNAELYNGKYNSRNFAGYLQMEKKVFDRLNLSGGMRYERNILYSPDTIFVPEIDTFLIAGGQAKEGKPVFRFGMNYQAAKATFIRASWGQGYRYPTIAEKFITTEFSSTNRVAPNPTLVSETGWTAEIGLKQGFQIGNWKGFTDVTWFTSEYNDMMEFGVNKFIFDPNVGVVAIFQSQNVGNTRIKGYEISALGTGNLGKAVVTFWGGYTFIDPKFQEFTAVEKNSSSDTTNVLKYRYRHTFKFDTDVDFGRWSIGANANYFSFMQAIDRVFQVFLPGVMHYRENNRHGSLIMDARMGIKVGKYLKVNAMVQNFLNTEYSVRPALLEAPRNYTLRLDAKF